jgi:phage terminase large subunit
MFDFETSELYLLNLESQKSVVVNQGGTSSGKTYAILQVLFTLANNDPGCTITVAGQDIPNLKVGALRDAQNIVANSPALKSIIESYNKSERVYTFTNGSIIEFNSYDDEQDAKSGKRDYLFVNEANGIPFAVYQQLALRTKKRVFIDYNPDAEFWVHEHIIPDSNTELFITDHRHNPFLDQAVRDKVEALVNVDKELWKVYARGKTGKIEGLIFRDYSVVEAIPVDATLIGLGLDFGFTNDPTALVAVYKQNGELYVDELIYETKLTNDMIVDRMRELSVGRTWDIIADSAEPKSIQEIANGMFNILPALKGPDSVKAGINTLKRHKLNVTKNSTGLRKELGRYKWAVDKDGKTLNKPIDAYNHAIDALRYLALNKLMIESSGQYSFM